MLAILKVAETFGNIEIAFAKLLEDMNLVVSLWGHTPVSQDSETEVWGSWVQGQPELPSESCLRIILKIKNRVNLHKPRPNESLAFFFQ